MIFYHFLDREGIARLAVFGIGALHEGCFEDAELSLERCFVTVRSGVSGGTCYGRKGQGQQ